MKENAKRLLGCTYTLRMVHEGSASLEHAILQSGSRWEPYVPTHFIYAFFSFNTLYNINWNDSLAYGYVRSQRSRMSDHEKIAHYLSFCCKEKDFLQKYKDFFIRYLTMHHSPAVILEELDKIQVDGRYSNGSVTNPQDILKFRNACKDCLIRGMFDKEVIERIIEFVYKIRCNIFHGTKTMQDMNNPSQQIRLDIYSSFIVAINQMIFSYLEYKRGDDITANFDYTLKRLEWVRMK